MLSNWANEVIAASLPAMPPFEISMYHPSREMHGMVLRVYRHPILLTRGETPSFVNVSSKSLEKQIPRWGSPVQLQQT